MAKKIKFISKLNKLNDWIGEKISYWLSTMTMFYLICIMIVIPLFFQRPDNLVGWIQYVIAVFFQGAALPVLGYVSRQVGDKQEKLIEETHSMVMKQFINMQNENNDLKQIIKDIHAQQDLQKIEDEELKLIIKNMHEQQELQKTEDEELKFIIKNIHEQQELQKSEDEELKVIIKTIHEQQDLQKTEDQELKQIIKDIHKIHQAIKEKH